jgi:Tfp pilus assembly protein PilF
MKAKAILVLWLMFMVLFISASGQQTAEDWNNKGLALALQGRDDEAISAFDKAIELNPQNSTLAEAYLFEGVALYDQSKYDGAIWDFKKAIELNPQLAEAYHFKGKAIGILDGRKDVSDLDFTKTLELDPQDVLAWNNLGVVNILFETWAFDKAIELNPQDAIPWFNKGGFLTVNGEYDKAIQAYDNATMLNPQFIHAEAWYAKGTALARQGKYDEAIQAFDKATILNPQLAEVWMNESLTLWHQGKYSEAKAVVDNTTVGRPLSIVIYDYEINFNHLVERIPKHPEWRSVIITANYSDTSKQAARMLQRPILTNATFYSNWSEPLGVDNRLHFSRSILINYDTTKQAAGPILTNATFYYQNEVQNEVQGQYDLPPISTYNL